MSNRRRSERFEVALPIWLKDGHGGERTETANVSSHGIAVFSGRARPLRQYIELEIALPAPRANINVTAVVARHAEFVKTDTGAQTAGLGLDFFLFDASAKSRWHEFLAKMRDEGTDFIPDADEIAAASESPNPLPERAKPPVELELPSDEDEVDEKPTFIIKPRDLGRLWAFYRGELAKGRVRIETPVAKPDGSEVELLVVHPTSRAEWTLSGYVAETKSRGERGKRPVLEINLVGVSSDLKSSFRNFVATGQGMIEEDIEIGDDSSSVQPAEPPRLESVVIDLDALDESSIDLPSGIVDPPPPLPEWSTDDLEEVAEASPAPYRAEPPTPSIRPPLSLVAATTGAPTEEPGRPITSDLDPPPPGDPPSANVLALAPPDTDAVVGAAEEEPSSEDDPTYDGQPVEAASTPSKANGVSAKVVGIASLEEERGRLLTLDDVRTATARERARGVAVDVDPTLPSARAVTKTDDDLPTADDGIEASFEDMFFASGLKRETPRVEEVPHVEDEPTVTPSMPPFTPAPLASASPTRSVFASFFEEAAASTSHIEGPPTPVPDDEEEIVERPPPIVNVGALEDHRGPPAPRVEDDPPSPVRATLSPSERRAASGARRMATDGMRASMGLDDAPRADSSATEVRDGAPRADSSATDIREEPIEDRARAEANAASRFANQPPHDPKSDDVRPAPRSEAEEAVLRLPTSAILTSRPKEGGGVRVYGPRDKRAPANEEAADASPPERELPDWVVPRAEALANPPRPPSKSVAARASDFPDNVPVPPGSMFDFEEEEGEDRELPVKPAPANRPNRRPPPLPPSARRTIRNPVEREHVGHKNVSTQGVDPDLDRDIGLARARVVRSPHSVTACYRLSMLLMQRGEGNGVGEALESLKKVMTLEPNHPGAHHKIAELLARKGDYVLAAEHLGRARRLGYRIDPDLERIVASGAKSS